jgi:hypothetical protein
LPPRSYHVILVRGIKKMHLTTTNGVREEITQSVICYFRWAVSLIVFCTIYCLKANFFLRLGQYWSPH